MRQSKRTQKLRRFLCFGTVSDDQHLGFIKHIATYAGVTSNNPGVTRPMKTAVVFDELVRRASRAYETAHNCSTRRRLWRAPHLFLA